MAMNESITTHYRARGFAETDDVVLSVTPRTRTIFRSGIHGGGVRGHLIRQKVGKGGVWEEVNEVNFTTLAADCGVRIELDTAATAKLYSKLTYSYELQKLGVERGDKTYVIAKQEDVLVIDDRNKAEAIRGLLDRGHSQQFWQALTQSNPDLASKLAAAKILLDRQEAIREFESALTTHAGDEDHWQDFFEDHPWMLQIAFSAPVFMLNGETYLGGKMPVGRQGKGGVATDFLFSDDTTKSFAVVEIKTPGAHLVGSQYRGEDNSGYDNEVYSMHAELSGGIVQTRNQITVAVEYFQSVLGKGYSELNRVHPTGVLVIGSTSELSQRQKDSFNQFRHALHSLTVIAFDELLNRLKLLFDAGDRDDDIPWPDAPMNEEDDWEEEVDCGEDLSF